MTKKVKKVRFDPKVFLATVNGGRSISKYREDDTVFSAELFCGCGLLYPKRQGQNHRYTEQGKEAVVAILGAG